jgi:hypothetical protein
MVKAENYSPYSKYVSKEGEFVARALRGGQMALPGAAAQKAPLSY